MFYLDEKHLNRRHPLLKAFLAANTDAELDEFGWENVSTVCMKKTYTIHIKHVLNTTDKPTVSDTCVELNAVQIMALLDKLNHFKYLAKMLPLLTHELIFRGSARFSTLVIAANNGHLDFIDGIITFLRFGYPDVRSLSFSQHAQAFFRFSGAVFTEQDDIKRLLSTSGKRAFCLAAQQGHQPVLNYFLRLDVDVSKWLVRTSSLGGPGALNFALGQANKDIVRDLCMHLFESGEANVTRFCRNLSENDFLYMGLYGHLEAFKTFYPMIKDKSYRSDTDIKSYFTRCLSGAASAGSLEFVKALRCADEEAFNDVLSSMTRPEYRSIFSSAAGLGKINVLRFFIYCAPEKSIEFISAGNYDSLREACLNGQIETFKYLTDFLPDKGEARIAERFFEYARDAISKDGQAILPYLVSRVPDKAVQEALEESYSHIPFFLFQKAARKVPELLSYLASLAPDKADEMALITLKEWYAPYNRSYWRYPDTIPSERTWHALLDFKSAREFFEENDPEHPYLLSYKAKAVAEALEHHDGRLFFPRREGLRRRHLVSHETPSGGHERIAPS